MKARIKFRFIFLFVLLAGKTLFANVFSVSDSVKGNDSSLFIADVELRTRGELRNGFRQLRSDTTYPAIFVSQRSRLNLGFKRNRFAMALSLQDIRTWGMYDPKSNAGTLQIFEAWAQAYFNPNLSMRIGKQRFKVDNQRFFAENDWRNNGGTHDAVNLIYEKKNFRSQTLFAWNQSTESNFYTDFAPVGFNNYKSLMVNYTEFKTVDSVLKVKFTNYYEGFQYLGSLKSSVYKRSEHQNFRYTNGARVEFLKGRFFAGLSAFIQWGHNEVGRRLSAFYFNPELKYAGRAVELRLGSEIKSGNNKLVTSDFDNSFQFPYGVAHRFNGTMEYFANGFPGSSRDAGLVDLYLFVEAKVKSKLSVSIQNHVFLSQFTPYDAVKSIKGNGHYLASESDVLIVYKPNSYTKVDLGFSALLANKNMELLSKGSSSYLSYWSYLQITFKPQLFNIKSKK